MSNSPRFERATTIQSGVRDHRTPKGDITPPHSGIGCTIGPAAGVKLEEWSPARKLKSGRTPHIPEGVQHETTAHRVRRLLCRRRPAQGARLRSDDAPKLLVVSDRSGNPEIYSVNPDGEKAKNLTNSKGVNSYPAWSPDHRRDRLRFRPRRHFARLRHGRRRRQRQASFTKRRPDVPRAVLVARRQEDRLHPARLTNGSEICIMDADGVAT